MKRYYVAKTDVVNPGIDSAEWNKANIGCVGCVSWPKENVSFVPATTFKLLRGPEGLSVLMHTNETHLRAEIKEQNGLVCLDSCMEFFFKPTPWDDRFLNFELNPKGVLHLGLGSKRQNRQLITDDRKIFDIVSVANEGDWTLKYYIPDSFIEKYFGDAVISPPGNTTNIARANFYKCGEDTDHSHFASWSEIETTKSDFHLPDFFGQLVF